MNVMLCGKARFGIMAYTALAGLHGVDVVAGAVSTVRPQDSLRGSFAAVDLPVVPLTYLRFPETASFVMEHGVDLIVLANVHTALHDAVRQAAPKSALCFHPSLLPLYRGADAVEQTIAAGDDVAGVSIFEPTDELDAGPILFRASCEVPNGATASSLYHEQLIPLGVRMLTLAVAAVRDGTSVYRQQTPALQLSKAEG